MFEIKDVEIGDMVKVVKADWGDEKPFLGKVGRVILVDHKWRTVAIDFGEIIEDLTWRCYLLPEKTGCYISINNIEKVYGDLVTELL